MQWISFQWVPSVFFHPHWGHDQANCSQNAVRCLEGYPRRCGWQTLGRFTKPENSFSEVFRNRMSNLSGNNAILKSEGQAGSSTSLNIFPSYHMIIKISMRSLMANLLQSNEAIKMHFACLSVLCSVTILPESLRGSWCSHLPKPMSPPLWTKLSKLAFPCLAFFNTWIPT